MSLVKVKLGARPNSSSLFVELLQTLCCIKLYLDIKIYNPVQFISWINVLSLSVDGHKVELYWS
jgi:hypothetical protein